MYAHALGGRAREKFNLTPDKPGCGHKAADTAESSERSMSLCLLGRPMYRSGGDLSIYAHALGSIYIITRG